MNFIEQKRKWSLIISVSTAVFLLLCGTITLYPIVTPKTIDEHVVDDYAVFAEEEDATVVEDEFSFLLEDTAVVDEEDAYDYDTEASNTFSDDFVLDDIVDTTSLKYTLDVTWSTLVSKDTVLALYENVCKDESHDETVYNRCIDNIKQSLVKAQDHMSTVDGKTTKIAYEFVTDPNSQELLMTLQVFNEEEALCYESTNALGIISNEGDV